MSKQRLQGKVAIVTGGATGIGAEAVRIFVENGASVVIADIKDELGHNLATSLGLDKVGDVRDEKQVEETVSFTLEKYGSLEILFSNAGIAGPLSSILDFDLNEFDNTMAVNLRGAMAAIHDYTASKHGLIGLVRSACSELGAKGIRVNSISPYAVATPLTCETFDMEPGEVEAAGHALANLHGITLKPTHIAQVALFLASDESAYISGHNLVVDGGFSVVNRGLPSIKN
ncbi:Xanthoxin dehydrogenase [Glycine soja]|uniref:Xanthoxin dehydrogenase n=1 Tax=Glycine soja TaxID=3848 RepID=A0A0B2PXX7_GLYSO|nr:Xanthoxin dehydrogenase [Glycine soja]